jgi:hypothetical protein
MLSFITVIAPVFQLRDALGGMVYVSVPGGVPDRRSQLPGSSNFVMLLEEWPTLVCPEEFPIVEASENKSPSRPLAAPFLRWPRCLLPPVDANSPPVLS